jgi:hypothetical protein
VYESFGFINVSYDFFKVTLFMENASECNDAISTLYLQLSSVFNFLLAKAYNLFPL